MRWEAKKPPAIGQTREKSFFAFVPVSAGSETRWLERVTVLQQYLEIEYEFLVGGYLGWTNIHFIDPPKEKDDMSWL